MSKLNQNIQLEIPFIFPEDVSSGAFENAFSAKGSVIGGQRMIKHSLENWDGVHQRLHLNLCATKNGNIWKSTATFLDTRKQKFVFSDFISPPSTHTPAYEELDALKHIPKVRNAEPNHIRILICSSVKDLEVAQAIQAGLGRYFEVEIWNQGIGTELSSSISDAMEEAANEFDFGVFVYTPDIKSVIAGEIVYFPNQNVVYEHGIFVGKSTAKRAFIVRPQSTNIKIQSDLDGVIPATYNPTWVNLIASLGPACTLLKKSIEKIGRKKVP